MIGSPPFPTEQRGRFDVIVSNPPYVADGDPLPPGVEHWEPMSALRAGADGLDHLRRIIATSPAWLAPDGLIVLEIGETQGSAVVDLAEAAGFTSASVHSDLAGRDRALVAHLNAGASES